MQELIHALEMAKAEIIQLRADNNILRAKVDTFELCAHLFYSPGPPGQGYGEDVAWHLGKHIEELRSQVPCANNATPTPKPIEVE